jgi:hypothetical protein
VSPALLSEEGYFDRKLFTKVAINKTKTGRKEGKIKDKLERKGKKRWTEK